MSDQFEHEVVFTPAWDKRNIDPTKNYGIHSVEMRFYLKKCNKAIQFCTATGWNLPHVKEELEKRGRSQVGLFPFPHDVGYHSPYPMYNGQKPASDNCCVIHGVCYYDGSSLLADDVFNILLKEGSEGVWKELEEIWCR